jgi:4-hydroxy-tetrahydrodipicolinate synthase
MISGSITALVTPFKNGKVDDKAFQEFVSWQIEQGTNGLVPCGTTGEASTLTVKEHIRVIELCVEAASGRVPVIAGIGSNNTLTGTKLAQKAQKAGADAGLSVAPYYNKPGQEGMYHHFKTIADAVDLPIIIYNIPGRSIVDINVETMGRLAKHKNYIGVKDATSDISRVTAYKDACGADFIQLSGDDPTALGHRAHGGSGCISVASNVAPARCAAFHKACAESDFGLARSHHEALDSLFKDLFLEASPAPTKYALSILGKMSADVRSPILECSDETKKAIEAAMRRAGLNI